VSASLGARIDALLPLVTKPARYSNCELNSRHRPWTAARVRWLLILPDVYEIGMSHQGLRILYDILNRRGEALADRAFAPWVDMEARMRAAELPLFSLESRRPARDFDVIGFSLSHELLATNMLNLLDLARVPLWSRERAEDDPLVAAGGPFTSNPEPLADFVDFFLIGDGEEAVGSITASLAATRGRSRERRLRALAELDGVYVPRFYEPIYVRGRQIGVAPSPGMPHPVRRTYVADLDGTPFPERPLVPLIEAVQDRLTLEIQRGCTRGCRFCHAGIFYRPLRERSPQRLAEMTAGGLVASGWDEVSLCSLSSADYSQIAPLARALTEALLPGRIGLSFSSLRVDTFSVELADLAARVRKSGLTFAPEAGTERLRRVINKDITDDDILAAVDAAYARGWRRVKLYFMIGLPTETDDDIEGIVQLMSRIRGLGRSHGGARTATASVGAFVPKPHTPFQWEAYEDRARLRSKIDYLRSRLSSRWSDLKWHEVDPSFVESVLARGDRRLAPVLHRVWQSGSRFDSWSDHFDIARWEGAFRERGVDPLEFAGARDPAAPLPWDHIDLGVTKDWLRSERESAYAERATADCREGRCNQCGLPGPRDRRLATELSCEDWEKLHQRLAGTLSVSSATRSASAESPAAAETQRATAEPPPVTRRCRLVFSKQGPLRFISHLETTRLLLRLFRMARWPLAFTQGHSPHPKISFGPPLPLGVEGLRELLDVHLVAELAAADMQRVNEIAPRGLKLLAAREVPRTLPSLAAEALGAVYEVQVPADLAARARAERRLEEFCNAAAVMVLKPSKGRQRTIDLRRCVRRIAWNEQSDTGSAGAALELELWLQEPEGHVLAPFPTLREVLRWGEEDLGRCLVTRVAVRGAEGHPLHALDDRGA